MDISADGGVRPIATSTPNKESIIGMSLSEWRPHQRHFLNRSLNKVIEDTQDSDVDCQHNYGASPHKVCMCTTGTDQQGTATVRSTLYISMDASTLDDHSW